MIGGGDVMVDLHRNLPRNKTARCLGRPGMRLLCLLAMLLTFGPNAEAQRPGGGYRPPPPIRRPPAYSRPTYRRPPPVVRPRPNNRPSNPRRRPPTMRPRQPRAARTPMPRKRIPATIKQNAPVAAMKGYTGQVTAAGKPVIWAHGTHYQIPQRGISTSLRSKLRSTTSPSAINTRWSAKQRASRANSINLLAKGSVGAARTGNQQQSQQRQQQEQATQRQNQQQRANKPAATANKKQTVLGKYPSYEFNSASFAAKRFSVPKDAWNKMSEPERWEANRKFLDRTIARGDEILLSTPADKARPGSYYAREIAYLKSKGYKVSTDGKKLIKE